MRLYYITNAEIIRDKILQQRRLRISSFENLNDPFELGAVEIVDEKELIYSGQNVRDLFLQMYAKSTGIICMSAQWSSPLMWAHYGEKHTGVCLGFDVPDDADLFAKVNYVNKPLSFKANRSLPNLGLSHQTVLNILTTKFAHWEYEREYRLFASMGESDIDGQYYLPFSDSLVLREIIIGYQCTIPLKDFDSFSVGQGGMISLRKAQPNFNQFIMEETG